jgi:RNA polymerase sigma factor (sigma-70 family)
VKQIINGIPKGVNYRLIARSTLSNLEELNLQTAEWIHFGTVPNSTQIKYILDTLAPNITTLRFAVSVFIKKEIKEAILDRPNSPDVVYGRHSFDGNRFAKFTELYLTLRAKLMTSEYSNTRGLIYQLAQSGNIECGITWEYLCLEDKSNIDAGPSAAEVLNSYGYSGKNIKHTILGVMQTIAPELISQENISLAAINKSNSVNRFWEKSIEDRQNTERFQAWQEQYNLGKNIFELGSTGDILRSLKTSLYLKRYSKILEPREYEIMQMRFLQKQSLVEVAKYFNVTAERIRQLESGAYRKLRAQNGQYMYKYKKQTKS